MAYNQNTTINANSLLDAIYPVGSIYMSVSNTSPASFIGGTWEQLKDRFLLGAGDSYAVNATGGEVNHTLTESEMPKHSHPASSSSEAKHSHTRGTMNITGSFIMAGGTPISTKGAFYTTSGRDSYSHKSDTGQITYTVNFNASDNWEGSTSEYPAHSHTITIENKGSGNAHNNMPPYLAVYMWKRTA